MSAAARRNGRSPLGLRLRRLRLWWYRVSDPLLGPLRDSWSSSLRLRIITISGVTTLVLVAVIGALILDRIGSDLYTSQRDQVLLDSARATVAAQQYLDATDTSELGSLMSIMTGVRSTVQGTSSSQLIYVRRQQAGQEPSLLAPIGFNTSQQLVDAVTAELAESLLEGTAPQYWQAVTLVDDSGVAGPGIIVASPLTFPSAGTYELYVGYSLANAQQSLEFLTRALLLMAVLLVLLLGVVVWVVSNAVFRPVRAAASTSHRLAAGEGDARMPLLGDRHFDELSENFNEMASTLQARIDELDTLSAMQQRFVSDVSHELRTPLTTIKLAVEVLRGQGFESDSAQGRTVEVLGTQVDRFESLLADLLEISRYDAGPVTLETESTNLVHLTEKVVEGLRPLSLSMIEVRALGGFTPVDVDPRRIRRIVSNLVGNAIEHGEGRPIVVSVDSNASAIAIGVRDWGVGMTPEHVERVFDRFWRADPSRKRTLGGTGLGLAIAREDAAVHGGLLEVWSMLGEGTNFRLTLPRGEDTSAFVSPVPLVPDDVDTGLGALDSTGGWLRRSGRRVNRLRREREQ